MFFFFYTTRQCQINAASLNIHTDSDSGFMQIISCDLMQNKKNQIVLFFLIIFTREGDKVSLWTINCSLLQERFYLEPFPEGKPSATDFCIELFKVYSEDKQQNEMLKYIYKKTNIRIKTLFIAASRDTAERKKGFHKRHLDTEGFWHSKEVLTWDFL